MSYFFNNLLLFYNKMPKKSLVFLLCLFSLVFTGCSKATLPVKQKNLEFTIVAGTDIPDDLSKLIKVRKEEAFQLTYSDGSCLYVVQGYGKQPSGGYSIHVNNLYLSEEGIVFQTSLSGPKEGSQHASTPTFPYLVAKTESRDEDVLFFSGTGSGSKEK